MEGNFIMLDDEYLAKGITGLARAVDHSWAQGHFGCAVIATYFLCAENNLPDPRVKGLQIELDNKQYSHHSFWIANQKGNPGTEILFITLCSFTSITATSSDTATVT